MSQRKDINTEQSDTIRNILSNASVNKVEENTPFLISLFLLVF